MLAGYLEKQGAQVAALTLGLAGDIEMSCAQGVARALRFNHHTANLEFSLYPHFADLQLRWTHLANGFNGVVGWSIHPHLRAISSRAVVGYVCDAIVGGSHISWAYSPQNGGMSFDTFFSRINQWGIHPLQARRLLRKDIFGELVDETIDRIRSVYEGYSEHESRRAWCFDLHHRRRYHVGSAVWALSFGAWPIMPVVDREMLATVAGIPAASMADRRAQFELVCTRFPDLAELNLDRNSFNFEPLRPRFRHLLATNLHIRFWEMLGMVGMNRGQPRKERRYYHRVANFNSPGWVAVRQLAEPHRERVAHLFNKGALDELLPRSDVPIRFEDPIRDASGIKALLGFILWSRNCLWF